MPECIVCNVHTDFITREGTCHKHTCPWCRYVGPDLIESDGQLGYPMWLCGWCDQRKNGLLSWEEWRARIMFHYDDELQAAVLKWKAYFETR